VLEYVLNRPAVIFVIGVILLWLAAYFGALSRKIWRSLKDDERETFNVVLGASLTLLGLIVGFTFSVAEGRYDQRKNYEVGEANAIGTEFVRADMLPPDASAKVKELLRRYLDQRILFYDGHDERTLGLVDAEVTRLQQEMWSVVASVADVQPTPIVTLTVSGMNDVLNSEGYTQAAWWYRIPEGAWALMATISVVCCALIGYGARAARLSLLVLVPLGLSTAFFFIGDIDSPRHGLVDTAPHNLVRLAEAIRVSAARAEMTPPNAR
jgi:hypothetical protein